MIIARNFVLHESQPSDAKVSPRSLLSRGSCSSGVPAGSPQPVQGLYKEFLLSTNACLPFIEQLEEIIKASVEEIHVHSTDEASTLRRKTNLQLSHFF